MAYPAHTPMAGAPRTRSDRMASHMSSILLRCSIFTVPGKSV